MTEGSPTLNLTSLQMRVQGNILEKTNGQYQTERERYCLVLFYFVGANSVRPRASAERPYGFGGGTLYAAFAIGAFAALSIFSMKMP